MGGGSGFGNGDPQSARARSRPRQFNLGQISSSRRDQALVRRVELRSIRLAKKVDRAVPCSMLKCGEAALNLASPEGAADPPDDSALFLANICGEPWRKRSTPTPSV